MSLSSFIIQCWNDFQQKRNLSITNKTPIPILWFGNIDEYMQSEVKIITVGLNPSSMEFKSKRGVDKFDVNNRFPKTVPLVNKTQLTSSDIAIYKEAMCEYFSKDTDYWTWFSYNERILQALGASYKHNSMYRAIHIDIYTPIATDPTWGGLVGTYKADKKALLQNCGYDFNQFVDFLNPDIIIVAANASEVSSVFVNINNQPCSKANSNACWIYANGQYDPYIRGYHLPQNRKLLWVKNCNGKPLQDISSNTELTKRVQTVFQQL